MFDSTSVIVVYCCAPCVYAHRKEGHCFTCEPLWQIPIFNNSSRHESHLVCPTNGQWLAVGIRHTVTYYITYCTYLYVLLLFNALIRRQSLCWRFSEVQISGGRIGPSRSQHVVVDLQKETGNKTAQSVQPMQEAESPKANRARLVGTSQTSPDSCSVMAT